MPTTDPGIATAVLDSLVATGTNLALLQQPDALLGDEKTGDIDVVVGVSPRIALDRASRELKARRLRLAALWHYDVGGTATAFFFDPTGAAGAQVDMLYDPKGLGHYSIRSHALLESSEAAEPFPIVAPLELSIYLFSKRSRKQQLGKLNDVKTEIDTMPEPETLDAVRRLVTSDRLATQITGRSLKVGLRFRRIMLRPARFIGRLAHPIGFWVHCSGDREDLGVALADRFGAVLIRSRASDLPRSTFLSWYWYLRIAQPIRLRPGIVASWGSTPRRFGPVPDLVVESRDLDIASRDILAAMSNRFEAR